MLNNLQMYCQSDIVASSLPSLKITSNMNGYCMPFLKKKKKKKKKRELVNNSGKGVYCKLD